MSRDRVHQYFYLKTVLGLDSVLLPLEPHQREAPTHDTLSEEAPIQNTLSGEVLTSVEAALPRLEQLTPDSVLTEASVDTIPQWTEAGAKPCVLLVVGETSQVAAEPFKGERGELLRRMISAMKIPWEKVARIEWRGESPREPQKLRRQMKRYQPKAVLILGDSKIWWDQRKESGQIEWWDQTPCLATFDLGHLLKRPQDKKVAWGHLQALMKVLQGP